MLTPLVVMVVHCPGRNVTKQGRLALPTLRTQKLATNSVCVTGAQSLIGGNSPAFSVHAQQAVQARNPSSCCSAKQYSTSFSARLGTANTYTASQLCSFSCCKVTTRYVKDRCICPQQRRMDTRPLYHVHALILCIKSHFS